MNAPDPTTPAASTETREDLLVKAIGEYQTSLECGDPPDRDAFLARHPEIAEDLADCLDNLDFLRNIAPQIIDSGGVAVGRESANPMTMPKIGDFRILREVGRGGMGVVYEAEQVSMARRVALKVLPFASVLDSKTLQRFRSEAQVAGQLVHQHIVPVYSVGCERSVHYYAMQFIEGVTLAELILELRESGLQGEAAGVGRPEPDDKGRDNQSSSRRSKADLDTSPIAVLSTAHSNADAAYIRSAVKLMIQVARALEYAHDQGVIHRDIKPSNLMVDDQGQIWVTDFGLAHVETGPTVTITGDFLGTLRYMSPEQALAQRVVVDHRTDIYSLGLTFYELLTQRPAFGATDRQELLRQISFEDPARPRRFNKAIPADLETILLKTIEKNPSHRYLTAADLADDLSRFVEDRPIHARRPTVVQRTSKWCRRHKSLVATTLAASFALLVFVAAGSSLLAVRLNQVAEHEKLVAKKELAARLDIERANNQLARTLARSYADKAQAFCESHEIATGMLWLAHSLNVAPDDALALRTGIRTSLAAWRPRLNTLTAVFEDDHGVRSAAISPDGTQVVTGSLNGRIRLWDVASGEIIAERIGHPRWEPKSEDDPDRRAHVIKVSFNPDGSRILSSARDRTARQWDANTLAPIGNPLQHPGWPNSGGASWLEGFVWDAVFSPDGQQIATCGGIAAQIWDAESGQPVDDPLHHPSSKGIRAVAFSPDGSQLATGGSDARMMVWDAATRQPITDPLETWGFVTALNYSPDGTHIIVADGNGNIVYWNTASLEPTSGAIQHAKGAIDIHVSGETMVSGGYDLTARVWDLNTRGLIGQPLRHFERIWNVNISHDESRIITASDVGAARLWTIGKTSVDSTRLHSDKHSVAFSPDGTLFAAGKQVWETATIRPTGDIPVNGFPSCASFGATRTGEHRLAFAAGNNVEIREARTLMAIGKPLIHPQRVRAISFASNGLHVATACRDQFVRVWDLESRTAKTSQDQNAGVDIAFSPDTSFVVTGGWDKRVHFLDADTLESVGEPIQCPSLVVGLAVSPDSTRIATALANGVGQIWSVKDLITIGTPMYHKNGISAVAFSPDGSLIVSIGLDDQAKFWNADTGQPVGPPLLNVGIEGSMEDVAYHPLGSHVLVKNRLWPAPPRSVEGSDERIRLWTEVITGMKLDMDAGGATVVLNGPKWRSRRRQLDQLGGPPTP